MNKPPDDDCCCGHPPSLHLYGTGMCQKCRRSCERFHRIGEGHGPAPFVVFCLIAAIVVVAAAFGLWTVAGPIVAAILLKF